MKFVFLYRGGNVSEDQMQANMQEWDQFIGKLMKDGKQKAGLPFAGGKVVTIDTVEDYKAHDMDVAGYSEIEAASMDEAIEIAKMCPVVKHGGNVEIREAMQMPGM